MENKIGEFLYPLTAEQLEARKTNLKNVKVQILYSLGGANYFTGGFNRRGYRVMFTPCNVTKWGMESVLLGKDYESGFYILLEETQRKSDKVFKKWVGKIDLEKCGRMYADWNVQELKNYLDGLKEPAEVTSENAVALAA